MLNVILVIAIGSVIIWFIQHAGKVLINEYNMENGIEEYVPSLYNHPPSDKITSFSLLVLIGACLGIALVAGLTVYFWRF